MPYGVKQKFIESLLVTLTEAIQEQEKLWKRGLITETEKLEQTTAIITKTAELLQTI